MRPVVFLFILFIIIIIIIIIIIEEFHGKIGRSFYRVLTTSTLRVYVHYAFGWGIKIFFSLLKFFFNECIISQEYCVKISSRSEQNDEVMSFWASVAPGRVFVLYRRRWLEDVQRALLMQNLTVKIL